MLDVFFALDRVGDALVKLHVDEALEAVALGEAGDEAFAVFVGAACDVGGDAGVENAVRAVGHDVDPAAGHARAHRVGGRVKPGHDDADP